MKVGLLDSRATRLAGYWAAFLKELGADVAQPALSDAQALELGQQSLPREPLPVQLALGRILAFERPDAVIVPQWSGVTGDAWSEALGELLSRRVSGLPTLITVPDGGEQIETAATELGFRLTHNASRVRLALEKVRPLVTPPKVSLPHLSRGSAFTVAVIGPRQLLNEEVLTAGLRPALEALNLYPVFSPDLPLPEVMQRAERMENAAKIPAGERELFGAASLLAGKSAVRGVVFVASERDGATLAAMERLARRMHKPTLIVALAAGQATERDWTDLQGFAQRLGASVPGASVGGTEQAVEQAVEPAEAKG